MVLATDVAQNLPQSCTTRLEVTTMGRRSLALVHDGQDFGGVLADAPGQKQVIEDEQVPVRPSP